MSQTIDLPDELVVTCKADGLLAQGLLASVSLRMLRKNDYHFVFGPSDQDGEIRVSKGEMTAWIAETREFFPMDYEDLAQFGGVIEVEPMDLREIEAALAAFETYHQFASYPPGYADRLRKAWETLYRLAPKRLDVEVASVPPPASAPSKTGALRVTRRSTVPH